MCRCKLITSIDKAYDSSCHQNPFVFDSIYTLIGLVLFLGFGVVFVSTVRADTLNFRGIAVSACTLSLPTDGTLSLSSNLQNWTTTTPATITAINTAPATLTVTKPTSWTASPANVPATTFSMTANLTGANVLNLTGTSGAASGTLSLLGSSVVSVYLTAQGTDTFKSGSYTVQATVTCAVN